ncbi:hypothetical protein T492DRAFT_583203, partial [Pavlovales sp. CCMP2436]
SGRSVRAGSQGRQPGRAARADSQGGQSGQTARADSQGEQSGRAVRADSQGEQPGRTARADSQGGYSGEGGGQVAYYLLQVAPGRVSLQLIVEREWPVQRGARRGGAEWRGSACQLLVRGGGLRLSCRGPRGSLSGSHRIGQWAFVGLQLGFFVNRGNVNY